MRFIFLSFVIRVCKIISNRLLSVNRFAHFVCADFGEAVTRSEKKHIFSPIRAEGCEVSIKSKNSRMLCVYGTGHAGKATAVRLCRRYGNHVAVSVDRLFAFGRAVHIR